MAVERAPFRVRPGRSRIFLQKLRRAEEGVTAIEFGMVAFPFLLFVLGIIAVGLQFFTMNTLDHAVETAARRIRTGEAQRANYTLRDFKQLVCASGGTYFQDDCNHVVVHVQNASEWAGIEPRPCADGGQMTASSDENAALADSSGGSEQVVLVTVCYDWRLPIAIPYLQHLLNGEPLDTGGSLLQSVATFRTEPYQ